MGEVEVITVLDDFEIRLMDTLNWRVWQHKELEGGKRKGEKDWVALDSYHSTVKSAVEWVSKHASRTLDDGERAGLEEAIGKLGEIERDIAKHAERFEDARKAAVA